MKDEILKYIERQIDENPELSYKLIDYKSEKEILEIGLFYYLNHKKYKNVLMLITDDMAEWLMFNNPCDISTLTYKEYTDLFNPILIARFIDEQKELITVNELQNRFSFLEVNFSLQFCVHHIQNGKQLVFLVNFDNAIIPSIVVVYNPENFSSKILQAVAEIRDRHHEAKDRLLQQKNSEQEKNQIDTEFKNLVHSQEVTVTNTNDGLINLSLSLNHLTIEERRLYLQKLAQFFNEQGQKK